MSDQIGSASIGLAVDSSGVDAGLNTMDASITRVGRSLSSLGRTGAQAVEGIGNSASTSATTVERATQRQIRSVQTLTAEVQAGGRATREFQETMARNRGGDAAVAQLRPYLDELDRVRAAQQAAAEAALRGGSAFQNNAQSAAALAASLRQVPAQLTDIVTSLQGGQAPLTVFLQQGGQLRDMFGSAGGAARALGGYLISLISPLTVGAAAVVALGAAYNAGSKEADAYRQSIVLTGNAAGVTSSQLTTMAKTASDAAGTQSQNAAALAQLVGTGKVAADQLAAASITAVQSQKYLGIAVEDTVKNFADLGKDPLQATLRLNEQYNYLTVATYSQIKALELQGKTSDAAKVAQTAYSDALQSKNKQLADSLGPLQKAWSFVGKEAQSAWDKMLNVGREDTIDEKIKKAETALKSANLARLSFIGTQSERDDARDEAQNQLDRLKNVKKVGDLKAQYDADEKKRTDAFLAIDKERDSLLSREAQQKKEIARYTQLANDARPKGQDAAQAAQYEKDVQTQIANIRAKYADINNQGIEAQIANIDRLGTAQEEVAKRALIVLQGNQSAGLNQSLDKQFEYIDAVAAADEAALVREKSRLQQRLALTAKETVSEDNRAAQQQKLADLRAQIDLKDQEIGTRRQQRDTDIFVTDKKNSDEIAKSYDALYDARVADTQALAAQLQAQNDQNATLGLSGRALEEFNTHLAEEKAARLDVQASILENKEGREDEAEELRKQAQLVRDLNKAQIDGTRKSAAIEANKTFWESVDRTAQSAFTSIFEGGKSAFDRLKDTLKAGLLDMLYQLTVKKWIVQISTSITGQSLAANVGSFLTAGTANATSTTLANGSSALSTGTSLANIGKSVYDAVSNGFAGLATSIGTSVGAFGNLIGSSTISGYGTGLASGGYSAAGQAYLAENVPGAAAGLASAPLITAAAGIASGVLAGNLISGGYSAIGGSSTNATAIGTAIGTYILPGIGSLVGGAVGGVVNRLFGYKSPEVESQGIQGTISASGVDADTYANILQKGGLFRSDKRYTNTADLDSATDTAFDKTVTAMITAVKGFGSAIGETTTSIDSYTKDFKLALSGDATKDQETIAAFFAGIGDELATTLLPSISGLTNEGETASAALQRLATDYVAMNAALGAIGLNFGAVGASSLAAREKLIVLTGGIDNFVAQAEFFSQNFLTEAERTAAVQKQLTAAFNDLGVTAIPKTRDEFKALVQGLDLTTDGGQKMYAGLLGLQEAFASVVPAVDDVAVAAQAAADALTKQKEQRALDIQLMTALGNAEGALAAQREDALAALTSDQARATQQQIYDAQDAADKLTAQQSKLSEQRSLSIQLMEAQGDAEGALAATRSDALAALLSDQARILQAQIYAAQDAKTIFDSLSSVADASLSRLSTSINAEKQALNTAYNEQAQSIRDATAAAVKSAQDSLTAAQTQASAIQTVFGALDSALSSTKIESDAATIARRQVAQSALSDALANPSSLADNKALTEALSTITGQGNTRLFGTFEEYARDQARTNNAIAALRDVAGGQVDNAAMVVKKLTETIETIQDSGDKQLAALTAANDAQQSALDDQLTAMNQQLDALKGIDSSTLSVRSAVDNVAAAIAALAGTSTGQKNAEAVYAAQLEELYGSVLGRASDQAGLEFYINSLKSGVSLAQVRQDFLDSEEYKAIVAASSASAAATTVQSIASDQLAALMARFSDSGANSAALLTEIQRLNELTANQQLTLDAIAASTGIAGDVLDRAQKGQPLATTTEK